MRPRVRYSRGWWRVHLGSDPTTVAAYGTWARAMGYANQIARKAQTSREESARLEAFKPWR